MDTIRTKVRVGPDGVLNLKVPLGPGGAGTEVLVTVQPATEQARASMAPEDWAAFVQRTAGSITDPTFMPQR